MRRCERCSRVAARLRRPAPRAIVLVELSSPGSRSRVHRIMQVRWMAVAMALAGVSPARPPEARAQEPPLASVRFAIYPSGARLIVGDRLVDWFGATVKLPAGRHRVMVDVPDSRCCPPLE